MASFSHGNHTRCRLLLASKFAGLVYQKDAYSQLPGVSHHHNKVDVSIDGRAHTSVIVQKFLLGHLQGATASTNVQRRQ